MRKSDVLNLFLSTSAVVFFCGFTLDGHLTGESMTEGTMQPSLTYSTPADFSQRLQGGILIRFEFGLIVVKPTEPPESLQPTALTTDAIITSSVRSKIADSQLLPQNFQIQTDAGVVTIHAKGESLDQAAEVINLALCVPDVRQVVYTMPQERSSGVAGVQELQNGAMEKRSIGGVGLLGGAAVELKEGLGAKSEKKALRGTTIHIPALRHSVLLNS
jgi:hypothetical protein